MLADHFPRTSAEYPQLVNWKAPFDWRNVIAAAAIDVISETLIAEQHNGRSAFFQLATLLREDLTAETARIGDGPEAQDVAGARFVLAVPAAYVALAEGLHGDCYGWLHWAISRNHAFHARINHCDYGLPPFDGAHPSMNTLVELHLVDWIRSAYMLARKFGGMDELARRFLNYCVRVTILAIARGDIESGVEALVSIVNWSTKDGHGEEERLTRLALDLFEAGGLPERQQVILAITFVTKAGRWTDHTPRQWAQLLLADYRAILTEHEVVQLLSVVMSSPEQWAEMRAEILGEIRKLADFYKIGALSPPSASLALEARVDIIHPLIFSLTEFGSTDDILDVLWAWYGTNLEDRCDSNVLFISSAHGGGVTYVWPTGRWTVSGPIGTSLQDMLDAVSAALTDYFRGPEGDRQRLFDERMVGAPVFEEAERLGRTVAAHYGLDALRNQLPENFHPRAIVALPAHRDPLQAMVFDRVGWIAPMEASLTMARPMRPTRMISVWPGATQLTDAELECIESIAVKAGWTVRVAKKPLNEANFQRFYEDSEPDILWVIGHGEQSPYRLEETGIIMEGDSLLPIARIASMTVPDAERRLLVLNICSSGATQNRGGIAHVGMGHYLTSPSQAVIAHLWPIDYYAALAFGCALATALSQQPIPESFSEVIRLIRHRDQLLTELTSVNGDMQALDRLSGDRIGSHLDNLMNWGCPVLLT